jgi:hypothetical protein
MAQMGHSDPKMTLGVYARVMLGGDDERARLAAVVGHARHGGMQSERRNVSTDALTFLGTSLTLFVTERCAP